MNSTLAAELERIVRAAEQESDNVIARLHEEMRQISTALKKGTREELARYAVESKRWVDTDVQIIGFTKLYSEANQGTS